MGVISIKLNTHEERILKKLSEYFQEDKSTLIKKSIIELYENILDLEEINQFETKEIKWETSFHTAEDILEV